VGSLWPKEIPPDSGSRGSNHSSASCVLPDRSLISLAGSVLGSDRETDRHAVDTRGCIASFPAAFRGNSDRRGGWAVTATYFCGSVWAFGVAVLLLGLLFAVLRVERSLPMRDHCAGDRNAYDAILKRMVNRDSPSLQSFAGDRGRPCAFRSLARTAVREFRSSRQVMKHGVQLQLSRRRGPCEPPDRREKHVAKAPRRAGNSPAS
jgi:hypothetical protein